MSRIEPSTKVYVAQSEAPDAGLGVFARVPIDRGDLIEVCPVITVPLSDSSNDDDNGLLTNYFFYLGKGLALVLGYGSLYNHSYNANARYIKHTEDKIIEFRAFIDIPEGKEITVNYNEGEPNNQTPIGRGVPSPST